MTHSDNTDAIRAWASERRLPNAHRERWLEMKQEDRDALLSVARALRLRTGAMVSALTTLEEIAARERCSVESVLARDDLVRIVRGSGSAPARAKAFLDALKAIRLPRLTETAQRLKARVAALGLPSGIMVVLPKDLSSDELAIELRARGGAEFKRLVEALGASAAKLAELADLLGGEREF